MTKPPALCARCGRLDTAPAHTGGGIDEEQHKYEAPWEKPDRMLLKQILAQYIADGQIVPPWDGSTLS